MLAQRILETVLALPVDEQFELFDCLRERLNGSRKSLSEEHQQVLDDRLADLDRNPADEEPWSEFEAAARARIGGQ